MLSLNTLGIAHALIAKEVRPGAHCIDATAGRGRDTALLCRLAGESGTVLAFDIQQAALDQTRTRLEQEKLHARLILDSHENLPHYAAPGTVDCIVFNFGRLPGGDPAIFTQAESSVKAVQAGLELLKDGGFMSLSIYYGGENGYGERDALLDFLKTVNDKIYTVLGGSWLNRGGDPPMPVAIWRRNS